MPQSHTTLLSDECQYRNRSVQSSSYDCMCTLYDSLGEKEKNGPYELIQPFRRVDSVSISMMSSLNP